MTPAAHPPGTRWQRGIEGDSQQTPERTPWYVQMHTNVAVAVLVFWNHFLLLFHIVCACTCDVQLWSAMCVQSFVDNPQTAQCCLYIKTQTNCKKNCVKNVWCSVSCPLFFGGFGLFRSKHKNKMAHRMGVKYGQTVFIANHRPPVELLQVYYLTLIFKCIFIWNLALTSLKQ
jgi:hypothetical protein